jgi:hypothetical protein
MKLAGLSQPPFSTSLVGVVKGALDFHGTRLSDAAAFGGSGHAFLINIHHELCPSGPYCWNYEPFYALVRNLGLEMVELGFFHPGTTAEERLRLFGALKAELDAGAPCGLMNMDDQLVAGYDGERLLLVQPWKDCCQTTPATLTFPQWPEFGGEVHASFWALRKAEPKAPAAARRESLAHALDRWRSPEKHSQPGYGIGPRAYDNWLAALPQHGGSHGNWWNATVWAECRRMAGAWFAELAGALDGDAAGQAAALAKEYAAISELLGRAAAKELPVGEKAQAVGAAKAAEEAAIGRVEELLAVLQ